MKHLNFKFYSIYFLMEDAFCRGWFKANLRFSTWIFCGPFNQFDLFKSIFSCSDKKSWQSNDEANILYSLSLHTSKGGLWRLRQSRNKWNQKEAFSFYWWITWLPWCLVLCTSYKDLFILWSICLINILN